MSVPDFQTIMLPLLKLAADGELHVLNDAVNTLADGFSLTDEERSMLIPSGQPLFYNRVGWARTYLKKAALLTYPKRGTFQITQRGKSVLDEKPDDINMSYLNKFPEYVEFRQRNHETTHTTATNEILEDLTPEEALEDAYQKIRKDLSDNLLEYVLNSSPGFFEKLVVELLVKMGYGGSQRNAAKAVGSSGDEGIDGIIDEDRLGLKTIYIQAKRWNPNSSVGRPEIQKFVGALQGKMAKKGVFIATTRFTDDARQYARMISTKVVLIDGAQLTGLMIDYGIGVTTRTTYEIKELDTDYFGESK